MTLLRSALPFALLLCADCGSQVHYGAGVSRAVTAPLGREANRTRQAAYAGAPAALPAKSSSLISIDLAKTPLRAATGLLQSQSGVNIVVSPRVYEERTLEELLVTVRLNDVTVETALAWITRLLRLQWYRQNDVLYVTVPGDAPSDVPTRVYSVHDLLGAPGGR